MLNQIFRLTLLPKLSSSSLQWEKECLLAWSRVCRKLSSNSLNKKPLKPSSMSLKWWKMLSKTIPTLLMKAMNAMAVESSPSLVLVTSAQCAKTSISALAVRNFSPTIMPSWSWLTPKTTLLLSLQLSMMNFNLRKRVRSLRVMISCQNSWAEISSGSISQEMQMSGKIMLWAGLTKFATVWLDPTTNLSLWTSLKKPFEEIQIRSLLFLSRSKKLANATFLTAASSVWKTDLLNRRTSSLRMSFLCLPRKDKRLPRSILLLNLWIPGTILRTPMRNLSYASSGLTWSLSVIHSKLKLVFSITWNPFSLSKPRKWHRWASTSKIA